MAGAGLRLAEVFERHFEAYWARYGVSLEQWRVVQALRECRTAALGWHERACDRCGHVDYGYNSCHNRHCPRCQWAGQREWVARLLARLPPVGLYHVVFTLPDEELKGLLLLNRRVVYEVLFRSASETLLTFGRDERWLGARLGVVAVLHTWGQTLNYHVHLHCLVTAGGLAADGGWRVPKMGGGFLFPVRALSRVFRGKFVHYLRKAYAAGRLKFAGELAELAGPLAFEHFLDELARQLFFVYAKPPFATPEKVVEYLGRYTHRVAISEARLRALEGGGVSFDYRDNRQGGRRKVMRLSGVEFIRRFLRHVLPRGFQKVRYYGLLSNSAQAEQLPAARLALGAAGEAAEAAPEGGADLAGGVVCPVCRAGVLRVRRVVFPWQDGGEAVLLPLVVDTS